MIVILSVAVKKVLGKLRKSPPWVAVPDTDILTSILSVKMTSGCTCIDK